MGLCVNGKRAAIYCALGLLHGWVIKFIQRIEKGYAKIALRERDATRYARSWATKRQ